MAMFDSKRAGLSGRSLGDLTAKRRKLSWCLVGLGLLVVLGRPGLVLAQDVPNQSERVTRLQLSPPTARFDLSPGASASGTFKVINDGTEAFTYTIYVQAYSPTNDQYDISFTQETARSQIIRWLSFSKQEGSLASREVDEISYTINVPRDVPAGGQYATVFVETGGAADVANTGVVVKQRIGLIVYARVAGQTRDEGEVVSQTIPGWQWYLPLVSKSLIANTGNTDFMVDYRARATNLFGRVRAEVDKEYTVLPETKREVTLELEELAPLGIYKVRQELAFLEETAALERWVWVVHPIILRSVIGLLVIVLVVGLVLVYRKNPQLLALDKVKQHKKTSGKAEKKSHGKK